MYRYKVNYTKVNRTIQVTISEVFHNLDDSALVLSRVAWSKTAVCQGSFAVKSITLQHKTESGWEDYS